MKVVGLTGGIGSGKSTVSKMFLELGVPVYNSDERAKKLMNTSAEIKNQIIAFLGEESYHEEKLNRAYIAKKVFNDTTLLAQLNAIVHPVVREDFLKWTGEQEYCYVIQETALLFENNAQHLYDSIILVTAPKEERISRVVRRDNGTREQVIARMNNQMDDEEKLNLSDFVIENIDIERTRSIVLQVHAAIITDC
ncbi:dephospho-CoA kinase [Maribacter sp. 1_2014MBL_MicDiv]|uniref:dephospho-CoA kinase n=1 Tax=Maribacter sp. 1_2014MBL_MicDiv TaxID=1644130 RepID=UPI0008F520A8|nr:dephospho-CoA kinase [Maribacter sp. 1_2014MBL_MicDiv]APA66148.1 dephospho-CoA kinase [Maribacter sp. 1_2014MBL_MicDiv]